MTVRCDAPITQTVAAVLSSDTPDTPAKPKQRVYWAPTIAITLIHLVALLAFLPAFFSWKAVLTMLVLHWVCGGLGVTLGYHRLLTHRSFKTPKVVEYFLSLVGSLNLQGGPVKWVACHRLHHQHSDKENDPHSPRDGFFWSHMFWLFRFNPAFDPYSKYSQYALDLSRNPVHVFIERTTLLWQFVLMGLLYLWGGWPCVIWGVFVRLVFLYHVTWFVNSASHVWGYRSYETTDDSRNLWWVALLSWGEGWHNNHHAFPRSARHGMRFWEIDVTWLTVRAMSLLGLAWDVRVPGHGASREPS